jgi:site-specific recombinase XerD
VRQVNTKALRQALERVGISDFRWHDQRHTWASWYVQAGTLLHVQQELGSWERVEMIRKYAHLASDHLAQYVTACPACGWYRWGSRLRWGYGPPNEKGRIAAAL